MEDSRREHPTRLGLRFRWPSAALFIFCLGASLSLVRADAVDDATAKFRTGDYAAAYDIANKAVKDTYATEALVRVSAESLLAQGRYNDAYQLLIDALRNGSSSIRLRLLLREACLFTGKDDEALRVVTDISSQMAILAQRQQYTQQPLDPATLADAGEGALLLKQDPKTILESFFDPAMAAKPPVHDAFLAAGKLALEKHDYNLASKDFGDGLAAFPGDADMLWGLAAAFHPSDREKFADYAKQAITANPHHIPTLLLLAENLIDAESPDRARDTLTDILKINPHQPDALALFAALAYLHNQPEQAAAYRTQALSTWGKNPQVDYRIGSKLSENYRFTLGADEERKALANDPSFTPARVQYAQDLLRLGQEDEGWNQAALAHTADGYDIEAFNLVSLHDELATYRTITTDHFHLVMEPQEAKIYGPRVLELLEKVRTTMTAKYGLDLNFPVLIEIFPNPADFSVRTFGMPDIGEFLGVTFGPVVTLNSPTTHDSNWEDVLWHEFTHVVTLTLTNNQMPRWLSEGISVYEEHQANPAWGQWMTPEACQRILDGKMQPISTMSAAFLQVKEPGDTEFAYFESMLVVQFFIEHYGLEHLKGLLADIGKGQEMNGALAHNFTPITQLDEAFAQYAKDQAEKYRAGWNFSKPGDTVGGTVDISTAALAMPTLAAAADPHSFFTRMSQIQQLIDDEAWDKARDQINEINATGLYVPGADNLYLLLAKVCAKLSDSAGEKAALTTAANHEADCWPAVSRLLEIAEADKDWPAVAKWGENAVAIHPLSPTAWRALLDAHEQLQENSPGIEAGEALLELDPPDLASVHYRLAKLMQPTDAAGTRRQVLQALEEAPRFRAAYDLLATLPPPPAATVAIPVPPAATPVSPAAPATSAGSTP